MMMKIASLCLVIAAAIQANAQSELDIFAGTDRQAIINNIEKYLDKVIAEIEVEKEQKRAERAAKRAAERAASGDDGTIEQQGKSTKSAKRTKGSKNSKRGKSNQVTAGDPISAPFCTGPSLEVCISGDKLVGVGSSEKNTPSDTIDGCPDGKSGIHLKDESIERIAVVSTDGQPLKAGNNAKIAAEIHAWAGNDAFPEGWKQDYADFYYTESIEYPCWNYIGRKAATKAGLQTIESDEFTLPVTTAQAVRVQFGFQLPVSIGAACAAREGEPFGYDDVDDLVYIVEDGRRQPKFDQCFPPETEAVSLLVVDDPTVTCALLDERCKRVENCEWRDDSCHPLKS